MNGLDGLIHTAEQRGLHKTSLFFNYPLKKHTSFQIGGSADVFFTPQTEEELKAGIVFFRQNGIPVSIIGGGKNLLISDAGIKGAVIALRKFCKIKIKNEMGTEVLIEAGAGTETDRLADWATENSLSGFDDFGGLPGTVGGAVFMNAKCYEKSISDILVSARTAVTTATGVKIEDYIFRAEDWDYKKSPFQKYAEGIKLCENRKIVLSATFCMRHGHKSEIKEKTELRRKDRIQKGHFKAPSAGSTFKNSRLIGIPSGKVIEDAGLKGFSIGGAQVAPWHGNFVINKGGATSDDVKKVIEYIQKTVQAKTGFLLEPEIIFAD